ncbi:hypothetical protein [Rhodobaculum claviforme]|uniref:Uncharacterized protein n=1 Tax=Rhodobaculum claviforme TaxID=1549854 RepID=A0A934WKA1_9RHOB|nr:hypothetical protein [Rhodobaculum claviforme]MBK5928891.1 hypothetical protein [Rhodobaculum claviforme]
MRHITDKTRPVTPQRTARFAGIERRALPQPAGANGLRGAEAAPPARRLTTYLARDAADAASAGRHLADRAGRTGADRTAPFLRIDRHTGVGPTLAALHARSGDPATVARTRAHLRRARAEAPIPGRHIADGPHGPAPARVARYVDFARAEGLHPSVRALRTRRGDATALIRLREFLRIARGEQA